MISCAGSRIRNIESAETTGSQEKAGEERAERVAAIADRLLSRRASARRWVDRIRASLPQDHAEARYARIIARILVGIAAPETWTLLREEFRVALKEADHDGRPADRRDAAPNLPILIAARDEAPALPRTLRSMAPAIQHFRSRFPGVAVAVHICDNASQDATAEILPALREEFLGMGIPLHLHHEPAPGKQRAIKRMLASVAPRGRAPERIVLADADVEWTPRTLVALWEYLDRFPEIQLAGATIVPRKGSLGPGNVWGVLDAIPFLGFGGSGPHGRGRLCRFVCGMTYMGRGPATVEGHDRLPLSILNEDVALSFLTGPEKVAIVHDAVIEYAIAQSRREFCALKARHVRGCVQLRHWAAALEVCRELGAELTARGRSAIPEGRWERKIGKMLGKARREALRPVRQVIEIGTIPIARAVVFERHETPVQRRDGSIELRRGVAVFHSPTHLLAIATLMLPFYTLFKMAARRDLRTDPGRQGWQPHRGAPDPAPARKSSP